MSSRSGPLLPDDQETPISSSVSPLLSASVCSFLLILECPRGVHRDDDSDKLERAECDDPVHEEAPLLSWIE